MQSEAMHMLFEKTRVFDQSSPAEDCLWYVKTPSAAPLPASSTRSPGAPSGARQGNAARMALLPPVPRFSDRRLLEGSKNASIAPVADPVADPGLQGLEVSEGIEGSEGAEGANLLDWGTEGATGQRCGEEARAATPMALTRGTQGSRADIAANMARQISKREECSLPPGPAVNETWCRCGTLLGVFDLTLGRVRYMCPHSGLEVDATPDEFERSANGGSNVNLTISIIGRRPIIVIGKDGAL